MGGLVRAGLHIEGGVLYGATVGSAAVSHAGTHFCGRYTDRAIHLHRWSGRRTTWGRSHRRRARKSLLHGLRRRERQVWQRLRRDLRVQHRQRPPDGSAYLHGAGWRRSDGRAGPRRAGNLYGTTLLEARVGAERKLWRLVHHRGRCHAYRNRQESAPWSSPEIGRWALARLCAKQSGQAWARSGPRTQVSALSAGSRTSMLLISALLRLLAESRASRK